MEEMKTPSQAGTKRNFIPEHLKLNSWEDIKPYYDKLYNTTINSAEELEEWIQKRQELEKFVRQAYCEVHVRYTCNTRDEEAGREMTKMTREIIPQFEDYEHLLNQKMLACEYVNKLPPFYDLYLKLVKNRINLYNPENTSLKAEIQEEAKKYSSYQGELSITYQNEKYTLQQASSLLKSVKREQRREVFDKIVRARLEIEDQLDHLFDGLTEKRHQVAQNVGFENFRDYRFKELARFDYTPEDSYQFHEAVKKEALPYLENLHQVRKENLELETLKPYDLHCDFEGKEPDKPFENADELISKTVRAFQQVHPDFGDFLHSLHKMEHLDLTSREGKAPGGYNLFMPEKGAPFIFMNSAGTIKDMITMIHEGGHAIHSFYKSPLTINDYHRTPPEVSELASMAMELIIMDHYDEFYGDHENIRMARIQQLERTLSILPWIATVDKFQHWIYTNPGHNAEERGQAFEDIYTELNSSILDWSDYPHYKKKMWQQQLHIFQLPFYYIEYGIAQLGAIALWRNYKENPSECLENLIQAMSMGYSRPVPEIFHAAGIKFDFSRKYINSLLEFVDKELQKTISRR